MIIDIPFGIRPVNDAVAILLAELMVGRTVTRPSLEPLAPGAPILDLAGVTVSGRHGPALDAIDVTVHAHEVVGIAGVAGNGQGALADLLSGLAQPEAGTVTLFGETVRQFSPRDMVRRGVGRIPEDRHASGVVGDMTVWQNLISESCLDCHSNADQVAGVDITPGDDTSEGSF